MKELSFADKVNGAYDMGWNSNPEFGKAVKEIESVVKAAEGKNKTISVQELFVGDPEIDNNFFKRDDDDAR